MQARFEDHGIRFDYPADWTIQTDQDGSRTTVNLEAPDGLAFVLISLDDADREPEEVADEALEAIRAEYPELQAESAVESLAGRPAIGHDVEFFSLDMASRVAIRCCQTRERTLLFFGQWVDLGEYDLEEDMDAVRESLEETDVWD